ncbi:hypothetical protein ABB37_07007 [Leptomonas pyrrhocoris]|uniref:Uncharacterized protein n=1 Tax=Leptomonas pyrrhocoris TaxID=157538 RepID=A0A0M9FWY8_LEPPY|nr:hypothetical protein ABB37_07007 [Leptomonas pyrrhocoris]KPA77659.1 hypothetical protein ABB37_07007 [Leptomonas pyrrhocoris]|eukprot:XP_015656098.1 hypothetical protein ABB37_07007 [Leptomonas pyrrhocoris]
MSSFSMRQRTHRPTAATVAGGGNKARPIHGSPRQLQLCKEILFAGFPCQLPYQRSSGAAFASSSPATNPTPSKNPDVRPLSKKFVFGFFQQYGTVEDFVYDEARGIGSVVFADGADAQGCYLAVHLSFLPAVTADGGVGQTTWEQDTAGEDLAERRARPSDLLLCLEFAHCCPFVNPVLLTKDVFVDGGSAHCEVPGGDLSRATLFHRFPQLLMPPPPSSLPQQPVASHAVMRWREEGDGGDALHGSPAHEQSHPSRMEVISDDEDKDGSSGSGSGATAKRRPSASQAAEARRVTPVGPHFPGRGVAPVEVEAALWQLLRPSHVAPSPRNVATVLDLWWEYYNLYVLHKTQPAESRIEDSAFRYASRPSLVQELLEVRKQGREYAHGDEEAAQQVLQRLVYDHGFHNVLTYLTVKQKFKYDPVWASFMRDLYKPKLALQVAAWQSLMAEEEEGKSSKKGETAAAAAAEEGEVSEARRRRIVVKAIQELHEPQPKKARDVEWVQRAEQTWFAMPRTTAAANVVDNVKFLRKVKRGEVDRNGVDKDVSQQPPLPTQQKGAAAEEEEDVTAASIQDAYPSMSARQKEEQLYSEVLQNLDGYVAVGTAEELVAMCEDPKLFRYARGHIGYEEAHHQPSYWLAYLNALWVPLIALLLMGFGSYYIVDRLGISKVNEMRQKEQQQREFHEQLRRLVEQQRRMMNTTFAAGNTKEMRAAMQDMNATMRKAAEAARKAGGKFNVELRGDL